MPRYKLESLVGKRVLRAIKTESWSSETLGQLNRRVYLVLEDGQAVCVDGYLSRPHGRWYPAVTMSTIGSNSWDQRYWREIQSLGDEKNLMEAPKSISGFACFTCVEPTDGLGSSLRDCVVITLDDTDAMEIQSAFCRPSGSPEAALKLRMGSRDSVLSSNARRFKKPNIWTPEMEAFFETVPQPASSMDAVAMLDSVRSRLAADAFIPFTLRLHNGSEYLVTQAVDVFLPLTARTQFVLAVAADEYLVIGTALIDEVFDADASDSEDEG